MRNFLESMRYVNCRHGHLRSKSYFEDIKKAMEEGRNLAEERYDNLYQNIGKGRLRDVEDSLK